MIEVVFSRKPLNLAISMSLIACFCVGAVNAQDTLNAKLERAETMLLGKTSPDQPVDARLNAIELGLFGKAKHGNVTKRVDSVLEFIGGSGGQALPTVNQNAGVQPLNSSGGQSAAGADSANGLSASEGQNQSATQTQTASPGSRTSWPYSTADHYSNSANGATSSVPSSTSLSSSSSSATTSSIGSASGSSYDSTGGSSSGWASGSSSIPTGGSSTGSMSALSSQKTANEGSSKKATESTKTVATTSTSTSKNAPPNKTGWPYNTKSAALAPLKAQEAKMAQLATPTTPPVVASKVGVTPSVPSVSKNVSQARELLREGLHEYSMGNYRDAELTFRKVLTVDPRSSDAFYNLGSIAERNHDYVMALTNYRAALNLSPHDKDYLAATNAMEKQLSSQSSSPSPTVSPPPTQKAKDPLRSGQNSGAASAPTSSDGPDGTPQTPIASGEPFQLSGTKNDTLMNSTQFDNRFGPMLNASQGGAPMFGVNQGNPPMMGVNQGNPPVFGVNQKPPKGKNGTLGTVLKVGTRAALYSSGLHCPICRLTGGSLHF